MNNQIQAAAKVRIVGQSTLGSIGLPFVLVSSATELGRTHCVVYAYEGTFIGSRMHCDCTAARFGNPCKHVLVARAWLAGRASVSHEPLKAPEQPQSMLNRTRAFQMMK